MVKICNDESMYYVAMRATVATRERVLTFVDEIRSHLESRHAWDISVTLSWDESKFLCCDVNMYINATSLQEAIETRQYIIDAIGLLGYESKFEKLVVEGFDFA